MASDSGESSEMKLWMLITSVSLSLTYLVWICLEGTVFVGVARDSTVAN